MPSSLPALNYEDWHETCDTLHAHTQVLARLAVALAPPCEVLTVLPRS